MIPKGALRCFLDGDALTIVKDDFKDLQASESVFVKLSLMELKIIRILQAENLKIHENRDELLR